MTMVLYHAMTNDSIRAATMSTSSWKMYVNVPDKDILIFSRMF